MSVSSCDTLNIMSIGNSKKILEIVEIIFIDAVNLVPNMIPSKYLDLRKRIENQVCQLKNGTLVFKIYELVYILSKELSRSGSREDIVVARRGEKYITKGCSGLIYDVIYLNGCQRSDVIKLAKNYGNVSAVQSKIQNEYSILQDLHKNGNIVGIQAAPYAWISYKHNNINEIGYLSIKYKISGEQLSDAIWEKMKVFENKKNALVKLNKEAGQISANVISGLKALHLSGRIHGHLCMSTLLYRENDLVIGSISSVRKISGLAPVGKYPKIEGIFDWVIPEFASFPIREKVISELEENRESYETATPEEKIKILDKVKSRIVLLLKQNDKFALGLALFKLWAGKSPKFTKFRFSSDTARYFCYFDQLQVQIIKKGLQNCMVNLPVMIQQTILNMIIEGSDSSNSLRDIKNDKNKAEVRKFTIELGGLVERSEMYENKKDLKKDLKKGLNRVSGFLNNFFYDDSCVSLQGDFDKLRDVLSRAKSLLSPLLSQKKTKAVELIYADIKTRLKFSDEHLLELKVFLKEELSKIKKSNPNGSFQVNDWLYMVSKEISSDCVSRVISIARRALEPFAKGSYGVVYDVDYFDGSGRSDIMKVANDSERAEDDLENEYYLLRRIHEKGIVAGIQTPPHLLISFLFQHISRKGYLAPKYKMNGDELSRIIRIPQKNGILLFPQEVVRKFTDNIISGLKFIHESGIVHGDIKVGNLLYRENELVIGDFGGAREISELSRFTDYPSIRDIFKGWVTCTYMYISYPIYKKVEGILAANKEAYENAESKKEALEILKHQISPLMKQNDRYALGVALYELWVGSFPEFTEKHIYVNEIKRYCFSFDQILQVGFIKRNLSLNDSFLPEDTRQTILNLMLEGADFELMLGESDSCD